MTLLVAVAIYQTPTMRLCFMFIVFCTHGSPHLLGAGEEGTRAQKE